MLFAGICAVLARGAKIQDLLAATAAYTVVLVAFLGTSNGPEVASRD